MTRGLWLAGLLALPWGAIEAAELVTMESREVVAWPALILRGTPEVDGQALARVPYGEQVVVVSSAAPGPGGALGGVRGTWLQVHWGAQQGWMFDAWLLPLPAPPADCPELEAWARRWVAQGSVVTEYLDGPTGDPPFAQRIQDFEGGMRWVAPELPGGPAGELWLPGVLLPQAWFAARRCHAALAPLVEQGWPPSGGSGLGVHRDGEGLRVTGAGGLVLLELRQEPDGVWLGWRL